jgi:hypothetical protein
MDCVAPGRIGKYSALLEHLRHDLTEPKYLRSPSTIATDGRCVVVTTPI